MASSLSIRHSGVEVSFYAQAQAAFGSFLLGLFATFPMAFGSCCAKLTLELELALGT